MNTTPRIRCVKSAVTAACHDGSHAECKNQIDNALIDGPPTCDCPCHRPAEQPGFLKVKKAE